MHLILLWSIFQILCFYFFCKTLKTSLQKVYCFLKNVSATICFSNFLTPSRPKRECDPNLSLFSKQLLKIMFFLKLITKMAFFRIRSSAHQHMSEKQNDEIVSQSQKDIFEKFILHFKFIDSLWMHLGKFCYVSHKSNIRNTRYY